jgi:hypothetical protein
MGVNFYTVGARPPFCQTGRSIGIGNTWVIYSSDYRHFFRNQLLFVSFTLPGDSGSVVVHRDTNEVWGLVFAGSSERTIANPIYQKAWQTVGTKFGSAGDYPVIAMEMQQAPRMSLSRSSMGGATSEGLPPGPGFLQEPLSSSEFPAMGPASESPPPGSGMYAIPYEVFFGVYGQIDKPRRGTWAWTGGFLRQIDGVWGPDWIRYDLPLPPEINGIRFTRAWLNVNAPTVVWLVRSS